MTSLKSVDIDLANFKDLGNDLLNRLGAMRAVDPIYWSAQNSVWCVTGHREVVEAFSGRLPLSNSRIPHLACGLLPPEQREARLPYLHKTTPFWLPNLDPPEHGRARRLMMKAFGKPVVEGIRPHVRRIVRETLDAAGKKNTVEYISEVCRRIPARVILRQLGVEESSVPTLHRWSTSINRLGNFNCPVELLDECERTLLECVAYS